MQGTADAAGRPPDTWSAGQWRERIRSRLAGSVPRHQRSEWLIPGLTLEQSQQHARFFPQQPLPAAVLIPIVEREAELTVLLTQRATELRNHPGQISFPGGRLEPEDATPRDAALREAREEIGLQSDFIEVIGYLPDHIVISGYRVTPVVSLVRTGFELALDAREVQDTFEVPLAHVFEPANHRTRRRRFGFGQGETEVELCDIPYGERNIWGATAGMLITLYRVCVLEAPR
ncbi:MAG TPA: CoA pyrophosphatase [Steroidobacteraceae bacterium]|nr:CoA pyrophosphatase [Steroidobacteraceae bacterium]